MKKPETELALLLQRRGIVTNLYALKHDQEKITLKLGVEEALCQTMEECGELVTACNKYRRRVMGKGQPTSESYNDVTANLKEELVDAVICIKELVMILGIDYSDLEKIEQEKIERTVRRMGL